MAGRRGGGAAGGGPGGRGARREAAGLLAVAIRPPTVPEGTARLRLVLRADLPPGTLEQLLSALGTP